MEAEGVHADLNSFGVSGGPGVAVPGSVLIVADDLASDDVVADTATSVTAASPVFSVSFADGTQPNEPLRMTYELPPGSSVPEGAAPILISRSIDGEYFIYDAVLEEGNKLSAEVSHLSDKQWAWLDPGKFIETSVNAVASALGQGSPKPDCVGKPVEYTNQTTTISTVTDNVAWTCVLTTLGSNAIEPSESVRLTSNSPFAWVSSATPSPFRIILEEHDIEGDWLRQLYAERTPGRTVLSPGETIRMDFGQYEQSPDLGELRRDPELDRAAYATWGYIKALDMIPLHRGLQLGTKLMQCAAVDTSDSARFAQSASKCLQGFASQPLQWALSKFGNQLTGQLWDLLQRNPGPTAVKWTTTTTRTNNQAQPNASPAPGIVLGRPTDQYSMGYGSTQPGILSINSLCGNTIIDITWSSWGGESATGTGTPCTPAASPERAGPVELLATDLGDCGGAQAYRSLVLDGTVTLDVCNG